jgi:predicted dehydrogenase
MKGGNMGKYRIGLVGANRGSGLVHPFSVFPETEIAALCDLNEKRLADAGAYYKVPDRSLFTDYAAFLNADIDVVVVGTPIQLHAGQAVQAMEAGKHVLSEVTAAWTIEQCAQIVDAVKRTQRVYMLAENNCYLHYIRTWKKWIDAGRLGHIFYAEAEYIHDIRYLLWDDQSGETYWRLERPPIYYCSHSLGPLLMLLDDRIVQATGAHSGYGIVPDRGPSCLNMEVALFKTQKGAVIKMLRSQVALREPPMHWYVLYGTKGSVESSRGRERDGKLFIEEEMSLNPRYGGYQVIDCPEADPQAPPEAFGGGHGTIEYYLVRDFIDTLENGSLRPPIDVIKAMDMTVPGIYAHQAAMSGSGWVDVPLFEW